MTFYDYNDPEINSNHSIIKTPNSHDFRLHLHEFYELYYFISGNGSFLIEGREYPLEKGCIILIRPGEAHCLHISPNEPYERIVVHFSPVLLKYIDPEAQLINCIFDEQNTYGNYFSPKLINSQFINSAMGAISDGTEKINTAPYLMKVRILCNLYPVLWELNNCQKSLNSDSTASLNHKAIQTAVRYINHNLAEPLNLTDISAMCFMDKSYLNQLFKKYIGSTIGQYILNKRLMLARKYLKEGVSATQTAALSGWSDYSSFYRQYKAKFGVSPASEKN